jgi:glycosyltransferase involved in cell wall biosynthesis
MKVLLIAERLTGHGGWYTYARDLKSALEKHDHQVSVVTSTDASSDGKALLPRPLVLLSSPWKAVLVARKVQKYLDEVQPDVIHITVEPYAFIVPFLAKHWQKKVVITIHGSYGIRPLQGIISPIFAKMYYRAIPQFITVSNYTKIAVEFALRKKWKGIAKHFSEHVTVVHNGITLPALKESTTTSAKKHILLVGGVKPRKGALEAIDACAVYKEKYGTPFHFTIVGDCDSHDSYVQRVQKKIEEKGLQNHVSLLGNISDEKLKELYRSADLYLMPALTGHNTFEGFGLVYIEANALSVPCIGPNDSGAMEAIVEGKTGFRVDPSDAEQIAERMHWILDEGRIDVRECREWAVEHNIDEKVLEIEKVYTNLK